MGMMNSLKIGEYVQFSYRDNPSIQLTGFVVNILNNTINSRHWRNSRTL